MITACLLWSAVAGAASYAGRPVQDVLRELGAGGINFIYNTALVPPGLVVTAEPAAGGAVEIAREILTAHGLALLPVGDNAFAVVKDDSQAGVVTGRVTDNDDRPIGGAQVALAGTGRIAVTDDAGNFRFSGVAPDRYRLDVQREGYVAASAARVRVRKARTADVRIALAPAEKELAEIVVTASRYALAYNKPQARAVMTQADVQTLPRLGDEMLRAVQRLPGSAASGISAQSHIRGGEFDEVLMVLDGLPLNEPFHLKNFLTPVSIFDVSAIESMEVYSGGFTSDYGGRMSGVIDITPLSPPQERYTELGVSLFHANALSAGTFARDRGQWLASIRRSNLDIITHAIDSEVGEPEYFDAFGRVSFDISDATTLFGSFLVSGDEMGGNTRDDTQRTDAEYRNTYAWAGWRQEWPGNLSSRLILALTDIDNDREGIIDEPGQRAGSLQDRRTLRARVARLDFAHEAARLYTRFGAEARDEEARYHYASTLTFEPDYPLPGDPGGTSTLDLDPNPDGRRISAYLTSRVRVTDRLSAELGVHWSDQTYDDAGGPDQFAPRLNVLYEATPATRLRAAWGRYWQAQGINELQVEDGVASFYPAQRADHLIFGFEHGFPRNLELRVEAYRKDYDHVRPHFENLFDPVNFMPELELDRVEVDPDASLARGLELTLARQAGDPWSWWLSYAWSRVTDRIAGADVARSWDQRNTLNAGLRYAGEHWEFTVTDAWHTGWPTTQLFLAEDPGGGSDVVTVGDRNAARFSDYNSLDFRVMRRFDLPDSTLDAFFEVTNALAQRNPCCTDYEVTAPGGVPVIDADEDYWPRFIPSFGVLWKF